MTGAFRTYRPVAADDLERLEARIASVLGPAIRWQLWLFFPPSAFGGDGLSMPCNDLPRRPPADAADMLFTAIDEIARHTAHGRACTCGPSSSVTRAAYASTRRPSRPSSKPDP